VGRYFRSRRLSRFAREFHIDAATRVLDVGGYSYYWDLLARRPRVTIVNLEPPVERDRRRDWVVADARALPFRDGAFEVAFSNSVVEHIPGRDSRRAYATEIQRIAESYCVQTPYRWFPIEPHLMTPLVHYLPKRLQRPLLMHFTAWGLLHKPTA
jgi:hypothetical protein